MGKTGQQIEHDIFTILQGSAIAGSISGELYQQGTRPGDSLLEDAVVRFAGSLEGQIQQGSVEIEIYVPDQTAGEGGLTRKNVLRCTQIEAQAQAWLATLRKARSDYRFWLEESVCTRPAEKRPEHGVLIKLNFQLPSF